MATKSNAISGLPEGYTLEQPTEQQAPPSPASGGVYGLPEGYTLEQPEDQQQVKANPAEDASQTRQMLVSGLTGMPTPNMSAADKASFERGKAAGAVSVPIVAGSTIVPSVFAPVTAKAIEYLPHLAKIIKTARDLGIAGFGLKEAHDLYRWFAEDK